MLMLPYMTEDAAHGLMKQGLRSLHQLHRAAASDPAGLKASLTKLLSGSKQASECIQVSSDAPHACCALTAMMDINGFMAVMPVSSSMVERSPFQVAAWLKVSSSQVSRVIESPRMPLQLRHCGGFVLGKLTSC